MAKTLKPLWIKLTIVHVIIGLVLIIGIAVLFRATLYRDIRDNSISGDHSLPIITAEVTAISRGSEHWNVSFRWTDENGATHTGRTKSLLLRSTADRLQRDGIEIRVRGGRAIPVTYYRNTHGFSFWITLLIGGGAFLFAWAGFTYFYNDLSKMEFIEKHGTESTGSVASLTDYRGTQTHKALVIAYEDEAGIKHEAKNPFPLSLEGGRAVTEMKTFPIKFLGNHAYVLSEPLNEYTNNNPQAATNNITDIDELLSMGGEVKIIKNRDGKVVKKVVTLEINDENDDRETGQQQLVETRCPNCKGIVELSEDSKRGRCLFCDTPFTVK